MRVVHVIGSLEDGGAEAVLYNLIVNTPHIHHSVVTLIRGGKYGPMLENDGIPVQSLELHENPTSILKSTMRLRSLIYDADPDAIQSWMYHAGILCAMACGNTHRSRHLLGFHNTNVSIRHHHLAAYAAMRSLAGISSSYRGVIYCSESARLAHESIGYRGEQSIVIPNGVSTERYRPCAIARQNLRGALGLDASVHLFGMVARVHPQKNHSGLVEALRLVRSATSRPFRIALAGRGTDTDPTLRRLIAESNLGDVVIALGPRNDIPDLLTAIDTLVLPSEFGEAFPMVLCEAISSGTPCIATDVGDSAAIVGDTGHIVAPGDLKGLADAMVSRILAGPESEDSQLYIRNRAIRELSIDAMASSYEEAWKR